MKGKERDEGLEAPDRVGGLHGIAPEWPMGIRILIVEDEAELADFVVRGLREEGFVVEHVVDGELARDAMRLATWDLVVLDWWLPGEDGLSVLRRFRQAGGTTPVLFLTARDAVADRVRGLDGGADDYLCKPFAFDELLARVRALVRRRDRAPEHGARPRRRERRPGRAPGAPRRPPARPDGQGAGALDLLPPASRPGAVADADLRPRLGGELRRLSNTLEVHVMELRRKLEAHGPRVIQTVRGRGYLYEAATPAGAP